MFAWSATPARFALPLAAIAKAKLVLTATSCRRASRTNTLKARGNP